LTNSPDIVRRKGHYWAVQISSAMQHLHEMNVIHRDMKPENVLLSSSDLDSAVCKLCDFGCSKLLGEPREDASATAVTEGLGTVQYISPELILQMQNENGSASEPEEKQIDAFKLDVYACGIIFSELNNPESALYAGMSKFAIMQAVLHENLRPTLPASEVCVLPDAGVELLRRMWDKDPAIRPSFSEIVQALKDMEPKEYTSISVGCLQDATPD